MEHGIDMTQVSLMLAIAFSGGLFFRALKLPTIMGYMIAGVLIGPGLLDITSTTDTIKTLAELAIVLLMFMIGLELDASKFRPMLGPATTIAVGQLILSCIVVYILGQLFSWSMPLILTLTFMLALSSTAVAVGSLRTLNLLDTKEGNLAVAILIAQDILVVPMLVIIGVLDSGLNIKNLIDLGITVTVILLSLVVIFALISYPKVVSRLEHFFTVGISQPVVAGIGLCFGSAALFGSIGLSAAYGAFVIGLLLGNIGSLGSTYRKAVAPIHDVLVMIFFISIGLLVDLNFVLEHWIEISVTVLFAVVIKIFGTAFLLRIFKFPWSTSFQLSGVLGHIGEFAFVLSALALANNLLTQEQYLLSITVIALSLIISPLMNIPFSKLTNVPKI
jgi:monovalent cation:H+ antiporter-2, CPA2 family